MADQKNSKPADDVVVCHLPPKASQFAAGEGGHLKGRPKDSRPVGAALQDIIRQRNAGKAIPTICVTELDELMRAFVLADNRRLEAAP
jgi:hypothetical protein